MLIMKDNILFKSIGNRKFVIELRFNHKATLSDKKGAIIENIKSLNFFSKVITKNANFDLKAFL